MSVVVDSSVVVAALLDTGPNGAWAEKVIEDRALYAPELVRFEVTNDAWYVAVAESLGFPLATLDKRLVKSDGPKCEFLTP